MKKIVKGNDFTLRIPVMKMVEGEKVAFPLPACTDVVVRIANQYKRVSLDYTVDVAEDNVILAKVEGDQISLGTYAVEVRGKIFGNDWRSNEYPQFQIVSNNADADTEFGQTDEGDNSVEMDTALVILPPTAELSQLISDTNEALKTAKATDETLTTNEASRVAAEQSRVEAETARAKAETARADAEATRAENETARKSAESDRANAEALRVSQESTRNDMEAERKTAETARAKAEETRSDNEATRKANESTRISNETARKTAETSRQANEATRQENETARQKTISNALTSFTSHQTAFDDAEASRVAAEKARVTAESKRDTAESNRGNAEAIREKNETARKSNEVDRQTAETQRTATFNTLKGDMQTSFDSLSKDMQTATANAQKAADDNNATNTAIKAEEEKRVLAESGRVTAEQERAKEEGVRQESETERIRQETARQGNEETRIANEKARESAEESREATLAKTKADCETATKAANDAASEATLAKTKAEEATAGAEKVDATIDGSTVKITNRNGEVSTYELEEWAGDERVTLKVTTSKTDVSVEGLQIFVYFNGADAHATYTTDSNGEATFLATHGSYYKVVFPDVADCDPIPSATYVAVLKERTITATYNQYSGDKETVNVYAKKETRDDSGAYTTSAFEGVAVTCTYDEVTLTSPTDTDGKATFEVPLKKAYTIKVAEVDSWHTAFSVYEKSEIANMNERNFYFHYYEYRTGVFLVDTSGADYTIDEWTASGKAADEALLVKLVTHNLMKGNGIFGISLAETQSGYSSKMWCESNVQFNNITLNGGSATDSRYYNGQESTTLIIDEGESRSLQTPAATYCRSKTIEIEGVTEEGYLPALGQWMEFWNNVTDIDNAIKAIKGDSAKTFAKNYSGNKWSSTQNNASSAWYFSSSPNYSYSKSSSGLAVPFYAC